MTNRVKHQEEVLRQKFSEIFPHLNEKQRRLFAAQEALSWGYGGLSLVARASGLSIPTIAAGIRDLKAPHLLPMGHRIRRPGAGRKPLVQQDPTLWDDLVDLIDRDTRGNAQSPRPWMPVSIVQITAALRERGHQVGPNTVRSLVRTHHESRHAFVQ